MGTVESIRDVDLTRENNKNSSPGFWNLREEKAQVSCNPLQQLWFVSLRTLCSHVEEPGRREGREHL